MIKVPHSFAVITLRIPMGYRIPIDGKPRSEKLSRTSKLKKKWLHRGLAISLACLAGCNAMHGAKDHWSYSGGWNEMMMGYRNEAWANKSWHARKHQFCSERHLHEFCEGFRAGYAAVADGSDGCTPAFAPRQYWGWKYQSAEGQEKVASWYAGYPHGARAAEEDGIGNWTQIQTSMNVQQQFADQGMLGPGQQPGMYPMPQAEPQASVDAKERKARGDTSLMAGPQPPAGLTPVGSAIQPNGPLIQR
jgi:hypothetical protein